MFREPPLDFKGDSFKYLYEQSDINEIFNIIMEELSKGKNFFDIDIVKTSNDRFRTNISILVMTVLILGACAAFESGKMVKLYKEIF